MLPYRYGSKIMMDKALISAKAGDGGNGCVSYHTSRRVAKGGPDGGNGGNGGNIIFIASVDVCTLDYYRYSHKLKAENGAHGASQNMNGKNGQDLLCKVPFGTQIYALKPCEDADFVCCRRCRAKTKIADESDDAACEYCKCLANDEACDMKTCTCYKMKNNNEDTEQLSDDRAVCDICDNDVCECETEDEDADELAAYSQSDSMNDEDEDSEPVCRDCRAILTDDDKYDEELLIDIVEHGQSYVAVQGGVGGFGNTYYKNASNQTPDYAQKGTQGSSARFVLRLKLIADVGIIGFPNAGKSSFLRSISNSKTKVADYPFTTLDPELGTIIYHGKHIIFADIPGLIEDAHIGKGLGHYFLSHIERCGTLLHLIDMTQENILDVYRMIRNELGKYDQKLLTKPEIVLLTKKDLCSDEEITAAITQFHEQNIPVICISNFELTLKHKLFENIARILGHIA